MAVIGDNIYSALLDALSRPHKCPTVQAEAIKWSQSFNTEAFTLLDACHDIVKAAIHDIDVSERSFH